MSRTMSRTMFTDHTTESAPEASRPTITATSRQFGFLPSPVARMAESPEALHGFLRTVALFEATTLTPLEREVLVMTVATRNECHYCVAMHTSTLGRLGAEAGLVADLRAGRRPGDERLAALHDFVIAVCDHTGGVPDADLGAFLAAGFTRRNALEVVLGIGTYTISTFANRLTGAPLDEAFAGHAWEPTAPVGSAG